MEQVNDINVQQSMPLLSIIAPVFNEEEVIDIFCDEIFRVMLQNEYSFEIVFIDDGSKDRTLEIILGKSKLHAQIKVISFSRNFGKEIALSAGLDAAIGEYIIPIDVDLQDPPSLIPAMLAKIREGYDVVYMKRDKRDGEHFFKKFSAYLFYRIMYKFSDINIPRDVGDFRIIDYKVVMALRAMREKRRFMKGMFAWVGFNQVSMNYNRLPRIGGKTKFNYFRLWNFALEGIVSFSDIPLKIGSVIGFFISIFSFIFMIFYVLKKLIYGDSTTGFPTMIAFVLFFNGIQLMFLGLIGEYIGKITGEVKERPLYLVKTFSRCNLENQPWAKKLL